MRRSLPSLNALAAFEAAARLGGFTRAAEELSVAQPAVTRHVTNLEAWLGRPLFHRRGNRIALTSDGRTLASEATAALDRLELSVARVSRAASSEVLIGASFGMTHMWLMPRISALRGAVQGVAINFVTSDNYRDFDAPEVDLSIRFGTGEWPGYRADLVLPEECQVIASPDFLTRNPDIDPDNLATTLPARALLRHADSFGTGWLSWPDWFRHMGHEAPDLEGRPKVGNFPTLLEMVKAGEGVAIGSSGLEDSAVEAGDIVRLGPTVSRAGHGYFLVYRDEASSRGFLSTIRTHLTGHH